MIDMITDHGMVVYFYDNNGKHSHLFKDYISKNKNNKMS